MQRKVSTILSLRLAVVAVLALAVSCGKYPSDPLPDPRPDPVWIALTATFESSSQIYLVDYNDPAHYKRVTQNNHQNTHPKFSPDRNKLIFLDKSTGAVQSSLLRLYDLESQTSEPLMGPLVQMDDGSGWEMTSIVFSSDGKGIYFSLFSPWIGSDILYYNIPERSRRSVLETPGPSEWVVGTIGNDTLIAITNDTAATHAPRGFYYMDLEGNYLSYIDNPHLEWINHNGVNKKAAYHPDWNNELGLFVYAEIDSTVPGFKIAVTDLHGSYYRAYTSGNYIDDHPTWGPEGLSILFQRRNLQDYSGPDKMMLLDLETGQVQEFVKPAAIDGVTSLAYPDY